MNINKIENLEYIWDFSELGDYIDDEGNFTDQEDFEWWEELADSLAYLEGVVVSEALEVNELQDYIDLAKKIDGGN